MFPRRWLRFGPDLAGVAGVTVIVVVCFVRFPRRADLSDVWRCVRFNYAKVLDRIEAEGARPRARGRPRTTWRGAGDVTRCGRTLFVLIVTWHDSVDLIANA
jgi:hypothetical protein